MQVAYDKRRMGINVMFEAFNSKKDKYKMAKNECHKFLNTTTSSVGLTNGKIVAQTPRAR